MAKEYNVGDRYYLPVTVKEIDKEYKYSVALEYVDCEGRETTDTVCIADEPDILLTAEEIYANRQMADKIEHMGEMLDYGRKKYDEIEELKARIAELEKENGELKADCNEWKDAVDEKITDVQHLTEESTELKAEYDVLKARNAELEALLKEVMATRDEAIKQNNELIAENEHQKSACEEQKRLAQNWKENAYKLDKEKEELLDAKERLDTAKEAITLLQQENGGLKSKLEDAEVMCGNAVDTSRKRQQKIATMEEVIVALVEKIRRLEGDD